MVKAALIAIFGFFAIIAVLVVYRLATIGSPKPPTPPSLSDKAAGLRKFMGREQVVGLLGPADWLIRETDKGGQHTWGGILREGEYELVWKNEPCTPVIVVMNANGGVTGWDEGRTCEQGISGVMTPPTELSCDKPDRTALCR